MIRAKFLLFVIVLGFFPFEGIAIDVDDEEYKTKSKQNLDLASVWLIQEGLSTYKKSGKDGIHRKLVDEWGVQIWTDPWVESDRYIDGFWIKARGINYEVINFHRETLASGIYEFWVVKVDGKDWSGVESDAKFYVTRTDVVYGVRELLQESATFIPSYAVGENEKIFFPVDDPQVLYELQAWRYPESYINSDIKNVTAIMKNDGTIELRRN